MRRALGVVGELLITAGVIVLLFVVYQLVWTNFLADRVATQKADQLEKSWEENGPEGPEFELPISNGDAFAMLRIPGIGGAERVPIVQGVTLDDLARGVGHYPETALPGEVGNFSVAGHRATNGEPFALLDQLQRGRSGRRRDRFDLVHLRSHQGIHRAANAGWRDSSGTEPTGRRADPTAADVDDV